MVYWKRKTLVATTEKEKRMYTKKVVKRMARITRRIEELQRELMTLQERLWFKKLNHPDSGVRRLSNQYGQKG